MGLQEHIIVFNNIIVHCGTRILDQYHFGAFHLHVIYQFAKKELRDLGISNL